MTVWPKAFLSVAALAASVTIVFLSMRDVMAVGGSCADGGPYDVETPCPRGSWLIMVGIVGTIAFAVLSSLYLGRFAESYVRVAALALPAMFGAMAWNFLEFGIDPPGESDGPVWGWLICGALFVAMAVGQWRAGPRRPRRLRRSIVWPPPDSRPAATPPWTLGQARVPNVAPIPVQRLLGGADDVATQLERVARLHEKGALDDTEFAAAKKAILGD